MFEDPAFLESAAALPSRPPRSPEAVFGAATWASRGDLRGILEPGQGHGISFRHCAPILEAADGAEMVAEYGCNLWLSEATLNRHLLGVGQPGCGKTMQLIWPLVAEAVSDPGRTVVVFDPKGDMYPRVRELAVRAGRPAEHVWCLDLTAPHRSVGWNPVPVPLGKTQAFGIAHQLCTATESQRGSDDSKFFLNNSVELIANTLLGLAQSEPDQVCLARAYDVINLPRDRFFEFCKAHKEVPGLARFGAFLGSGSHSAETVLADAASRLLVFLDKDVCAVTAARELDLDVMATAPRVLVVQMREVDLARLRPIYNVLLHDIVDRLIRAADSAGGALPVPAMLVLDEFASAIGRIPEFEVRLNTMRSRRIAVVAAVQGLSQLEHMYGVGATPLLAGFTNKVFFAGLERSDAEYASRLGGTMTARSTVVDEQLDREGGWQPCRRSVVPIARPLLLPEEIAQPRPHFELGRPATFFLSDTPPFQVWLTPAWRRADLAPLVGYGSRLVAPERSEPLRYGAAGERGVARLRLAEESLDVWRAPGEARDYWRRVQRRLGVQETNRFVDRLREAKASLRDLHGAFDECRADDPWAVYYYLQYRRRAPTDDPVTGGEHPELPF